MSSTFRRRSEKSSPSLSLPGTKPWTGGITLTSSGLRDLDVILGSGQPLGTLIWLEEDRWTNSLALSLIKYWCAEGLSQEHILLIPLVDKETGKSSGSGSKWDESQDDEQEAGLDVGSRENIIQLLYSLPRNLHFDKVPDDREGPGLTKLDEEGDKDEGSNDDGSNDEGLKIAWQYRRSVQQERLGHVPGASASFVVNKRKLNMPKEFCHSYDLQGSLSEQLDVLLGSTILNINCRCKTAYHCTRTCGIQLFKETRSKIESELKEQKRVVRVLFYHISPGSGLSVAVPLLLSYIRGNQLPVVVMVASQTWTEDGSNACLNSLRRMSDVVLGTEGFASRRDYPPPSEFRMFQGLLKVRKLATLTAATANQGGGHFADLTSSRQPAADLYGLKRDRRKLHIQMLHIPPEEFVEGGGSTAGVRSGAGKPRETGLSCAGSSGGALDF